MNPHGCDFDAIVIGSGMGGMTVAGLLAKINNMRILVLEKHFEIGGLTHEFTRGSYSWDVGLHYIGTLNPIQHILLSFLTNDKIKLNKMPTFFEKFVYPDFIFKVPDDPDKYKQSLIMKFPDEAKSISKYFRDIKKAVLWYRLYYFNRFMPVFIRLILKTISFFLKSLSLKTTQEYLDENIKDKKLKSILVSQWLDYGLPPRESSFAIHAMVVNHYLYGACFPSGGSSKISRYIESEVEKCGGTFLCSREVTEILVKNGKAVGVNTIDHRKIGTQITEYRAPLIISNAGIINTYNKLLPENYQNSDIKNKLNRFHKGYSMVTLYLGLKESPAKFGIKGENIWINVDYDYNDVDKKTKALISGKPTNCTISFPSLKNGEKKYHTVEVLSIAKYSDFEEWKNEEWKNRSQKYYQLKEKITAGLLKLIENHIPGFTDIIVYKELATPLDIEYFTGKPSGAMYGIPTIKERFALKELKVKTNIKNLLLTGSDVCAPGIMGALMGGLATASYINGPAGIVKIIAGAKKWKRKLKHKPIINNIIKNVHNVIHSFNKQKAKLIKKKYIRKSIIELTFELKVNLDFIPGQYAKIQISETEWRAYSIVELKNRRIKFIINTNPGGLGSHFVNCIKIGDICILRLPLGNFYLRLNKNKKIFITTGTGITPFLPMLSQLKKINGNKNTELVFGCKNKSDYFISPYIDKYRLGLGLKETICLSQLESEIMDSNYISGRITKYFQSRKNNLADGDYYISGNPFMVQDVTNLLRKNGIKTIISETY